MLAGKPPFKGPNEYQTFQRIIKLEYQFPDAFPETAKSLVKGLLVLDPSQRLGCPAIKAHPFFAGIDWANLPTATPPKVRCPSEHGRDGTGDGPFHSPRYPNPTEPNPVPISPTSPTPHTPETPTPRS